MMFLLCVVLGIYFDTFGLFLMFLNMFGCFCCCEWSTASLREWLFLISFPLLQPLASHEHVVFWGLGDPQRPEMWHGLQWEGHWLRSCAGSLHEQFNPCRSLMWFPWPLSVWTSVEESEIVIKFSPEMFRSIIIRIWLFREISVVIFPSRLWFLWPDENTKNKRSKNKCGCLGGCRFFGGTVSGLDFFKLEDLTPSSSSAFSSTSAESDMFYGQSLLQPGEWIITKELPKITDGNTRCFCLFMCVYTYVCLHACRQAGKCVFVIRCQHIS